MNLLEKQYEDPHRLLASYRREIKQMFKIKSGDAVAFRRLFNFLIKRQTLLLDKQILNKLVLISCKWKTKCMIMKYQIC